MDDLIRRSDAIKEIMNKPAWHGSEGSWFHSDDIKNAINNIPAVEPKQEWIPCEERTPKLGQKVLASTKKTVFTQVFKGYYEDPTRWNWEHNSIKKIEAWMPLPEPYMKGADNE